MFKTATDPTLLSIGFDKIDGLIVSLDDEIKHLILFDYGLFNSICDTIKYLINKKVV